MNDTARRQPDRSRAARLAIAATFGLLTLAVLSAAVVALSSTQAANATRNARQVRDAQEALFVTVQEAETGQRGYLLTGDPTYLDPYEHARLRLPQVTGTLRRLLGPEPAQQARLGRLAADVDREMIQLGRTVRLRQSGDVGGALMIVKTNEGRDIMTRIRQESADFDTAQNALFQRRQTTTATQRSLLLGLTIVALLVTGVLAFFVLTETRRLTRELAERNAALQREMAERADAEAQLRQAQKMESLGQLTGGIAHDFNNMLAVIVGNLDLTLRRMPAGNDRVSGMIENALGGAQRAALLTKRLLAFSRRQPLNPAPTDVNKCVADMSEMLRRSLGENMAIETVLGGGLWRAFIDCPQLESAILNLSVNARDAMKGGGRLTIETSNSSLDRGYADGHEEVEAGQYVLVAVTDTGGGIPPDVLDRVFEPFFTTKAVGQGTGLGLSQVHGFIKQSRGHVKIYSEVGVGTTVKLYLPRDLDGPITAPVATAPCEVPGGNAGVKILVVEDDPGVRSFVVGAVRDLGYAVAEADGAVTGLERLSADPEISLVLTDVIMPGETGRQLVDRALKLRPDLKVVYMTGYTRNAIVHNGALDPGTRLITKPFTMEELQRELFETLSS